MQKIVLPLAALAAVVIVAPAEASAAPRQRCDVVRPAPDYYEAGTVASELLTVPNNRRCTTISVMGVRDTANPADRCQTFLVQFLPSESETSYTDPVQACSYGGRRTVLATDVPDGMPYRVLYRIDYLGQSVKFRVAH
ncbi:hypothetical protein AB0J80_35610 [Actinoplanes sp. NPDC049548]|uniref:hypothetical protein n=1 Tax=Actinoplanes sp. NPDC049548 TaxID=3155152 RepID=UPI00343486FD